jgi:hypothetical protein
MHKDKRKLPPSNEDAKKTSTKLKKKKFRNLRLETELEEINSTSKASETKQEPRDPLSVEADKKFISSQLRNYRFPGRVSENSSKESSLYSLKKAGRYDLASQNLKAEVKKLGEKLKSLDLNGISKKKGQPLKSDRQYKQFSTSRSPENCYSSRGRRDRNEKEQTETLSDMKNLRDPYFQGFLKRVNLKRDKERQIHPSKLNVLSALHPNLFLQTLDYEENPKISEHNHKVSKKQNKEQKSTSKENRTKSSHIKKCLRESHLSIEKLNQKLSAVPSLVKTGLTSILKNFKATKNPFSSCKHGFSGTITQGHTDWGVNFPKSNKCNTQNIHKKRDNSSQEHKKEPKRLGLLPYNLTMEKKPTKHKKLSSKSINISSQASKINKSIGQCTSKQHSLAHKSKENSKERKDPSRLHKESIEFTQAKDPGTKVNAASSDKQLLPKPKYSSKFSLITKLTINQKGGYFDWGDAPHTDRPTYDRMNFL